MPKPRKYVYKDELLTCQEISELSGYAVSTLSKKIQTCKPGDDVTSFVGVKTSSHARNRVFFDGEEMLSIRHIAQKYSINWHTLADNLRGVQSGTDVSDIVRRLKSTTVEWYILRGDKLSKYKIAKKLNIPEQILRGILKRANVEPHSDVTVYLEDYLAHHKIVPGNRKYLFNGELLAISDIARAVGVHPETLRSRITRSGIGINGDVTDIAVPHVHSSREYNVIKEFIKLTGDTSVGGLGVSIDLKNIYSFLSLEWVSAIYRITIEFLAKYNYEGRKPLGYDKACRSKWLTDDLWIYQCPDCWKHLVLTTEEIVNHVHGDICDTHSVEEVVDEEEK